MIETLVIWRRDGEEEVFIGEREEGCEGYVKKGEVCVSEGDQESTYELCFESKQGLEGS